MIGRVRNQYFGMLVVLFTVKFAVCGAALDLAIDIRDSWAEGKDGRPVHASGYAEAQKLVLFSAARLLAAFVGGLYFFCHLAFQAFQPTAPMLSLGWDLGLVSMCTLMLVAVQHGARDFINNEGVFLVDATLWLMILITLGFVQLLQVFRALQAAPLGFKVIMTTSLQELEQKLRARDVQV